MKCKVYVSKYFNEFWLKYFDICKTHALTLILIFIVCPSLKLRSNLGPASNGFEASIFSCSSLFTTLKTGCNGDKLFCLQKYVIICSLAKIISDWRIFTYLKWSCIVTLRSKESALSWNPIPINALLPGIHTKETLDLVPRLFLCFRCMVSHNIVR